MNQPTRTEMLEAIRIYSSGKHSRLVEYKNRVRRNQITPLFRVEVLREEVETIYRECLPKLRFASKNS